MFSRNMVSRNMFSRNECFQHFVIFKRESFLKNELFSAHRTGVAFHPLSMVPVPQLGEGPE